MANMLVCQYASEKECELSEQDTWLPLLVGRFCSVSVNMTQHCAHPLSLCESLSRWPLQSCASGTCYSFKLLFNSGNFSIQHFFRLFSEMFALVHAFCCVRLQVFWARPCRRRVLERETAPAHARGDRESLHGESLWGTRSDGAVHQPPFRQPDSVPSDTATDRFCWSERRVSTVYITIRCVLPRGVLAGMRL